MLIKVLNNLRDLFTFIKFIHSINKLYKFINSHNLRSTHLNGKCILINSVRTYVPLQVITELYFALLLKTHGAKVYILYDDNILFSHDTQHVNNSWLKKYFMKFKISLFSIPIQYCHLFREHAVSYSKLTRNTNLRIKFPNLKAHILSSLARYYLSSTDINCLKEERDYFEVKSERQRNAELSYEIAAHSELKFEPDCIITSHGIYSTWGPFFDYFKSRNTKLVTYGINAFEPGSLDISINDLAASRFNSEFFDKFHAYKKRNKLDDSVEEYSNRQMQKRISFKANDQKLFKINIHTTHEDPDLQRKLNEIEPHSRVIGIFPNVLWDNATTLEHLNTIFSSPTEWIVQTLKSLLSDERNTVLLRIHPAEGSQHTKVRKGVYAVLEKNLENFRDYKNLIIIKSDSKYSSYKLFQYLDIATIYNGTIGYELLYKRIPTIVASNSPFSKCLDLPKNRESYFNMLSNASFSDISFDKDKFNSLVYYYFKLHHLKSPILKDTLFKYNDKINYSDLCSEDMTRLVDLIADKRKHLQEIILR